MNIYLVDRNSNCGYDEYSDFVVVAETEEIARYTHPLDYKDKREWWLNEYDIAHNDFSGWVCPLKVKVTLLGEAHKGTLPGIICASFNAG